MAKLQNLLQVYFGHQVRYIAFLRQQLHTLGVPFQTADVLPVGNKWVTQKTVLGISFLQFAKRQVCSDPKSYPSLFIPFYQIC